MKKKKDSDDIKVVVMNPDCMPQAQERMFDFFFEKHTTEARREINPNEITNDMK